MSVSFCPAETDSVSAQGETERLIIWMGMILFIVIVCWAIFFMPMSDDEANPYHLLACWAHPFSHLDASDARGCDHRYDIVTPFGFAIQRTFQYEGVLPSLLYAPLYFLTKAPGSLYVYGLISFLAFAFLISQLTEKPWLTSSIVLAFYPFVFTFIHDMGPVKFDMLLYPVGALLVKRASRANQFHAVIYALALSVIMGLAFEEKPFFLYLLPGFAFFCLAFVGNSYREVFAFIVRARWALTACAIVTAAFIGTILLSTLPDGMYYFELLHRMSLGEAMPPMMYAASHAAWTEKLFRFFLFWPSYAHRYLDLELVDMKGKYAISFGAFSAIVFLPAALVAATLAAFVFKCRARGEWKMSVRTFFLLLSVAATLMTFMLLGSVYAGHHFLYLWVPLLMLFADLLGSSNWRWQASLAALFFAANVVSVAWLTQVSVLHETSGERAAIEAYFDEERASHAIINHVSWGGHLIQALYGPTNELTTAMASTDDIKKLFELSRTTGRSIYMVCRTPEPKIPFDGFNAMPCSQAGMESVLKNDLKRKVVLKDVLPGLDVWHVYEVLPD